MHSACSTRRNYEHNKEKVINMNPLVLEGAYQGKNLYVQNPMTENGWCTLYVEVNGVTILDSLEVQKAAYEIDLISMDIEEHGAVIIKIYHRDDCFPKVLNPEVH